MSNFLRNIFLEPDNSDSKPAKVKTEESSKKDIKFPEAASSKPTSIDNFNPAEVFSETSKGSMPPPLPTDKSVGETCAPYIEEIKDFYNKGFSGLNKPGYDFYEFYKAIITMPNASADAYKMAFAMAKSMDATVTKGKLISDSNEYLQKITEVYKDYVKKGKAKRTTLKNEEVAQGSTLRSELAVLDKEIANLMAKKSAKEEQLNSLDNIYKGQYTKIDCKLQAHEMAKKALVSSIKEVSANINKNTKD